MSKPRYNWWGFALAMIRDYPARRSALRDLREQKITADLSGMPRGGGASRTIESVALRQLPAQEQREYDAVHKALLHTKGMKQAELRMEIIRLTMWKGYTIPGAAIAARTSEDTARRYRWQFIMLVGCMYGFLTEEEYQAEIKKEMFGRKLESQSQNNVLS